MTQTTHKVDGWQPLKPSTAKMTELFDKFAKLQQMQLQLNEELKKLTLEVAHKQREMNGSRSR